MALAFGILSIFIGFFAPWVGGWVGFGIAALLGGLGVFLCIRYNKKKAEELPKKAGGMICGIIGIVIAFMMQLALMGAANMLKEKAQEVGDCPIFLECTDSLKNLGVIGLAADVTNKGFNTDDMQKELDRLTEYINGKNKTTN